MQVKQYDRTAAVAYAHKWAYGRNPAYLDFSSLGGDCTNYVSQCIFAGSGVMNYKPLYGWYYRTADDRTPSWTGVPYLYNFLSTNEGVGPFAEAAELQDLLPGDIVQLGTADGRFYHTPIVTGFARGRILVCAHTFDALDRPLDSYVFDRIRALHILGVRV